MPPSYMGACHSDRSPSADPQAEGVCGTRAERVDGMCPHAPSCQEVPEGPGTDGAGEHGLDPLDRSLAAPSQHSEELPP